MQEIDAEAVLAYKLRYGQTEFEIYLLQENQQEDARYHLLINGLKSYSPLYELLYRTGLANAVDSENGIKTKDGIIYTEVDIDGFLEWLTQMLNMEPFKKYLYH